MTLISDCEIRDAAALAEADLPVPDVFAFPFGLVEFRLPCAAANMEIIYHGGAGWTGHEVYRKYGPTTPGLASTANWYTLPGVMFDTTLLNGTATPRVQFTLRDGELGDDTAVDGEIVDQGGPAVPPNSIPTLSGWILIVFASILAAAGAHRMVP